MRKDAQNYVKRCEQCQKHATVPRVPSEPLHPINSAWPFAQWGMDIVGPFPTGAAQKKLLLVATDYFTKWVEAEAYAAIKDRDVIKFVWKNIVCRFGIPQAVVSDNGPQFASTAFRNFCSELKIKNLYSTPRYPQGNGQAEASKKAIVGALKKRLHGCKGGWVDELPGVLWAHRTTPRRPTNSTPFALAFGMEAIIPTEIGMPTIRSTLSEEANRSLLERNLDWADEEREAASIRIADYQQCAIASHNKRARPRAFRVGDMVLRRVFENTTDKSARKLHPNWEGPYVVTGSGGSGSYFLQNLDGVPLVRPWNVSNLKRFYH